MADERPLPEEILAAIPAPVVVSRIDDGLVLYANRHAARAFGLTVEEMVGRQAPDFYVDPRARERIVDLLKRHGRLRDHEAHLRSASGETFWVLASAEPLGRRALCTMFVDISNRRRAEEEVEAALVETARRLSTMFDTLPGYAYRCANDRDWTVADISRGCRELTGYDASELTDNRVVAYADLIHPDDRERVWENVQAAVARREPFQLEYRIVPRGGGEKWVWEQGVGVFQDDELVALEGVVYDIGKRKQAEARERAMEHQMRAAQRMDAIGRLAGGVAHDFNNLLTVIQSYAGLVAGALPEGAPALDQLAAIREAADRGARLTGQLLALGRRQVLQPVVVELNEVVSRLDDMLRRLIGEDVELALRLDPTAGRVEVDIAQLEQVVINLAVNARDALPEGGTLTIATRNVDVDEGDGASAAEPPPGRYVALSVRDDGVGMDAETQSQIFEPFFTTKERGRGTGLGLSTVYGIVKQSRGYVTVDSAPGRGTQMQILLPRVEREAAPRPAPVEQSGPARGTETILLVEDEDQVRDVSAQVLRSAGYEVLAAAGGAEALALCEQRGDEIALLLTDLVMPKMSGRELAEQAVERWPHLKVMFMSGYADRATAQAGSLFDASKCLWKPFAPEALRRAVRRALDR